MPDYKLINGQTISVPGIAELNETVILNEPGPTPAFAVPVLVGDAPSGIPYNFDSLKMTSETALGPFRMQRTDPVVHDTWGYGSDVAVAFRNAQEAGLPMAFITTTAALTRSKVVVTSAGPVNQFTLYSRLFGAPGRHHKVKFATDILTISPVLRYAMLSVAVTTTTTRVYVTGADPNTSPIAWMAPGQTVYLGDSDTADFAVVVDEVGRELDTNGQWKYYFDLTGAAGTAVEISTKYGMVILYGDDEISPTFLTGEGQKVIDWVNNNSKVLGAEKHADFTGALPIDVVSATPIKDLSTTWGTITNGVSPASTSSDWSTFFTNYKATYWDQFRSLFGLVPRVHLLLTSDATVHGYARAFAVDRRKNVASGSRPVSILLGAAFTDTSTSASNSTNSAYRARALNHQDVGLFGGQFERLPAYLSLAAYAFGQLVNGGSLYSITRKAIRATGGEVTKLWDETNTGELTTLIKAGVITYMLSPTTPPVWQFTSGVNTNQDRTTAWSSATNSTCMMAARNSIDEFNAGLLSLLDAYSGKTGVAASDLGAALYAYAVQQRDNRRIISDFGDPVFEESANEAAWRLVTFPLTPVPETLYIGVNINIFVG